MTCAHLVDLNLYDIQPPVKIGNLSHLNLNLESKKVGHRPTH